MKHLIFLGLILLAASALPAQWAGSDDAWATPYQDAGGVVQTTDNGGSGYSPWDINVTGSAFMMSTDARNFSGDAALNVVSDAFVLVLNGSGDIEAIRELSGVTVVSGTVFQFELQAINSDTGYTHEGGIHSGGGASVFLRAFSTSSFTDWRLADGLSSVGTGIPASSPIRVTMTYQGGSSYDIEVDEIGGTGSYGATGNTSSSSNPDSFVFFQQNTQAGGSTQTIFNRLYVDPTGALPVELDEFHVE